MYNELKPTIIGKIVKIHDNSYCYNLITKKSALLGGSWGGTEAVEVMIISEPYNMETEFLGKRHTYEFITVLYKGEPYTVVNSFTEVKPKCSCCGQVLPEGVKEVDPNDRWKRFAQAKWQETGNKFNTVVSLKKESGWGLKESKDFCDELGLW